MKIFKRILIILGIILIVSYLGYDYYYNQDDIEVYENGEKIEGNIETKYQKQEEPNQIIRTDEVLNNDNYYNFSKVEKLSLMEMIESMFIKEFYTTDILYHNIYGVDKFGITQHITSKDGFIRIISIEDKHCIIDNDSLYIRVIDNDNNVLDYDDIIQFIKNYHKE